MKKTDVYSYGVIASSTLYLLKDHYPAKSGYAEIEKKYKQYWWRSSKYLDCIVSPRIKSET